MTERNYIKQKPEQQILPDIEPNKCGMTARDFLKSEPDIREFINNPNLKLDLLALNRPSRSKRSKSNIKQTSVTNTNSLKRLHLPSNSKNNFNKDDTSLKTQVKIYKNEKVVHRGPPTQRRSTLAANIV